MSLGWLGTAWVRILIIAGCAMYTSAASAGCVIVGLAGGMSLMSCTGGIGGTMFDLGNGLASYRLSNGVSGMFAISQSSTGANATATTTSTTTTTSQSSSTTASNTSFSVEVPSGPTVSSGASVTFLIKGATKSPAATSPSGASAGPATTINPPLNAPLTPSLTNVATAGFGAPAPKPAKPAAAPGPSAGMPPPVTVSASPMPATPSAPTTGGAPPAPVVPTNMQ